MQDSELILRLFTLRGTIRRRLIGYGVCAVAAGGIVAFVTIVALDWLLRLPPALRIVVASLFLLGFILAFMHWIVVPLRTPLTLEGIAARLERYFTPLTDRLSSAVSFLESPDAGSPKMMHAVISDAESRVRNIALDSALSLRPFVIRIASLAVALAIFLGIYSLSPAWIQTGACRYLYPFGEFDWPRSVEIVPLTGDRAVAIGDSVTLRMRIQRGQSDALRAVLRLREMGGETVALTMQRVAGNEFEATVDAVTEDLRYWFDAGDDSTEKKSSTLRAVARPEILHAMAAVSPPPYASARPERIHDLAAGPVVATVGSGCRITLRTSKPNPQDPPPDTVGLRIDGGAWIPLNVAPDDPLMLVAQFQLAGDIRARPELRDEEGFGNRGPAVYEIRALPDLPPVLDILEPQNVVEVTPKGSLRLVARVSDDFGVKDVTLQAETSAGRPLVDRSLSSNMRVSESESGVEAFVEHKLELESHGLSAGEVVLYTLSASDNFSREDSQGQIGKSVTMRISIISDSEFDIRLRSDIALLEARVRHVTLEQLDVLDRTNGLGDAMDASAGFTEIQRQSAVGLSAAQVRLIRRVRELGLRFQKVAERLEGANAEDQEGRNRLINIAQGVRSVADDPMSGAAGALANAAAGADGSDQERGIDDAAREQQRAAEKLQGLIRSLSQWGSFQGLLAKTGDLLERQDALRQETAALGRKMLGKPVSTLTAAEASELKRSLRRQEQLSAETEQLLARMAQLRAASREKEPSAVEAVEAALRTARANELTKRLSDAVAAIRENRTAAAMLEQKAAADAFRKMASALREREERELALLQKRLRESTDQLAELIQDQEGLRAATNEAGSVGANPDAFEKLSVDQGRLRRNAIALADEVGRSERAAPAVKAIRQAGPPMVEAESHLREIKSTPAIQAQDVAIAALRDALDHLERLAQEAQNESVRRTLAQIREELEALRTAQADVNAGIARLRVAIAGKDRLERSHTREASNLGREQSSVREAADAIVPDLEKIIVYRWAMDRIVKWMDSSRLALDARRIDDALSATTERIVSELDKLIRALVETEALPASTDFVEADAGGDGAAEEKPGKAIPTVAELLVLKAMQTDINQRTEAHPAASSTEGPSEGELRQLQAIGEDQAEVRRLAELVAERANNP